jgi:hypothetical protein
MDEPSRASQHVRLCFEMIKRIFPTREMVKTLVEDIGFLQSYGVLCRECLPFESGNFGAPCFAIAYRIPPARPGYVYFAASHDVPAFNSSQQIRDFARERLGLEL